MDAAWRESSAYLEAGELLAVFLLEFGDDAPVRRLHGRHALLSQRAQLLDLALVLLPDQLLNEGSNIVDVLAISSRRDDPLQIHIVD